ncbi:transglutaminase domain-containing protein [Neptunomonas sp. XY-337]|uniref:transglutaminase domain-containing protein n=1 Tax=Neptunomonas sp. XY-337 TaxID=2561897 RepID=UPI0010AAA10D|nr:transglutaminase domain-containing protein [Neptunomonas sp. XY-337]
MKHQQYCQQTRWSSVGNLQAYLDALPSSALALADALENTLIHHGAARHLGFGVPEYAEGDRDVRYLQGLLALIVERDARPLTDHRDLPDYAYVTCRDFALFAVAKLRSEGIPARLRVGFVSYLKRDFWEDHWLCEYYQDGQWHLFDAQLGARARDGFRIRFDITKLPKGLFMSAARMWCALRSGDVISDRVGVAAAGISGEWFAASNLFKDLAAQAMIELLPWDYWGLSVQAAEESRVSSEDAQVFDQLALAMQPGLDLNGAVKLLDSNPYWSLEEGIVSMKRSGKQSYRW